MSDPSPTAATQLSFDRPTPHELVVRLAGSWLLEDDRPTADRVGAELATDPPARRLAFNTTDVTAWDSSLLTFLIRVLEDASARAVEVDTEGLPPGVRRLMTLARAVPEAKGARRSGGEAGWLARIGQGTADALGAIPETLEFLGELTLSAARLLRGRPRFRARDFWWVVQQSGAQALPIVGLLAFLIGLILAYVGAIQLRQFGAQIYVANLVGLAVAREMGAMMTGIILAGRTGAAFAAQLGAMQAGEEIDALKTLAISPMDFLVLPRVLALILMMPLLGLYADLLGLLGGGVIGVAVMDLGVVEYYEQSRAALAPADFAVGLVKCSVFGVMVALAGCYHGIRAGRSSAAVGNATTAAVVTGIVLIIVSDAILTVIFDTLGV